MHLKHNPQTNAFEALDENGSVIPLDRLPPALRDALSGKPTAPTGPGERVTLARPFPTGAGTVSSIVHVPTAVPVALTADERKVCQLMGISEADFLAMRTQQPSKWASPKFGPQ